MIADNLWVEKYRPRDLDDLVMDEKVKKVFQTFIDKKNIPHCLFVGSPGTGKTTLALILKDKVAPNDNDFLFLNASDSRGISDMRNTVIQFMKVPPYRSPHKVVVMDESDSLTNEAWMILRNPIENDEYNYNQQTRFIFTANYMSKIPNFMKSRCSVFEFSHQPREFAFMKARNILATENISYDEDTLIKIIDSFYPDLRAIINSLQRNSMTGELNYIGEVVNNKLYIDKVREFVIYLHKNDYNNAMMIVTELRTLIRNADVNVSDITKEAINDMDLSPAVFVIFNRYLNTFGRVLDDDLHFIAMLYDAMIMNKRMSKQ